VASRAGVRNGTRRMGPRPAPALCLLALLLLARSAGACDPPTLLTISPDGTFEDWAAVLANPGNVTLDGDGSAVPCAESPDRDCIVPQAGLDLRRFAWTYDETALYIFVERFAAAGGSAAFHLYVDVDRDGRLAAGADRVAVLDLRETEREVSLKTYEYDPLVPGGDPLADALGHADGYSPPGALGPLLFSRGFSSTASPDAERFEADIPWAALGLAGPLPTGFHLGVRSASPGPESTVDNLGGPDGGPGTTGFHHFDPGGPGAGSSQEGAAALYAHRISNLGNLADGYALRTTSSEGYEVRLYTDPDGDGDPADGVLLGLDRRGDGDYTDPGDERAGDTDGDTFPDTGAGIPAGGDFRVVVEVITDRVPKNYFDTTRLLAVSLGSGCEREARDETFVGKITLGPARDLCAEPGTHVRLCHRLTSHLDTGTTIHLEWISSEGWSYEAWSDPDGDCDPADGFLLQDQDGDGFPDIGLGAGETSPFVLLTDVPPAAPLKGRIRASILDTVRVAPILEITPSHLLADGTAKTGSAGRSLYFAHRLRWSGPRPETFTLSVTPPAGHAVSLHTDPDGDGHPSDSEPIPAGDAVGPVPAFGGTYPFLARLDVTPGTGTGTEISFDVTGTAETSPGISRVVADEAIVSAIAAYADPLFVLQESRYAPCQEVHALATGLVPGRPDRYRMRWVREDGALSLQTSPFASDSAGAGADAWLPGAAAPAGDYSVRLEEWDGIQWSGLDLDAFRILEYPPLEALGTDRPRYAMRGDDVLAWASFHNSGEVTLSGVLLRFLILDPGGILYAQNDGTFAQHLPGDASWSFGPLDLDPGQRLSRAFTMGPVEFLAPGSHSLRAWVEGSCGAEISPSEISFDVVSDVDRDGWSDDEEAALGTNAFDRDTDDDGLPDPLDGDWDSDGDTLIDALECDADGDWLPDGLEAGLVLADLDPDTDTGAGCFHADGDGGATITNRLDPDTDGGGEPDGFEDLNGDGVLGPGEKDPLDPSDDPCSWFPPPEVENLHLLRQGLDLLLAWDGLAGTHPCVSYRVLAATTPPTGLDRFTEILQAGSRSDLIHPDAARDGALRFYLAVASGRIGGEGALGHYGQ